MVTVPESCDGCGACCHGYVVDVEPTDLVPLRLKKRDPILTELWEMRTRKGACIALRRGRCSIYEIRPQVCRDYVRGSAACLQKLEEAQTRTGTTSA